MHHPRTLFILVWILFLSLAESGCRNSPSGGEARPEEESAAGPASIRLSEEAVRTGGIAVERARVVESDRRIAAVGELEFNGRRLAHLTARAPGRIESILAFRGERVVQGQTLAEIYSTDYLALQAEVIQAGEREVRLRGTPDEKAARDFLGSARSRLLPLGMSQAEIDALILTKSIQPLLEVRAPFNGRVIEQVAVVGDRVEPGASLFRLADLSTVWASVRIYEKDLAVVQPGVEAVLRTQAFPGEEFQGRLVLIGPTMEDKTRTIEARVEVANPGERLKPGMYVEALIATGKKLRALVIPESALQDFQSRPVVFVKTGQGAFELRLVEAGERTKGCVEITGGLAEGEEVVTAGSFLLKSEMLKQTMGDEHEHD
jgi:multidrug efflux pump subunit AcrA (membrane-fusion protein)